MSGYCPAGKCECENFCKLYSPFYEEFEDGCKATSSYGREIPYFAEVCPWPSRQVGVEKGNDPVAMHEAVIRNESFKHGLAEGIRRCREAVEKIAESHPDINVNAENGWVKLSVIIAAIDAVEGE